MIYHDSLFTANQQHWADLKIPYIAQSSATNYVVLSSMGNFVIDYDIDDVKVIPVAHEGGTFDPIVEADKAREKAKDAEIKEQERAEAQSIRDGGKPKIALLHGGADPKDAAKTPDSDGEPEKPEELMGNDLEKDPILL